MKIVCSLLLFLSVNTVFSQDLCSMFSINLDKKDRCSVSVDKNNSDVTLYFFNNKKTKAVLLDDKSQFVDSLVTESKFKTIIADNLSNKIAKIVSVNETFTLFTILKFDFNTKKESTKSFTFNSSEKNILQVFYNSNILNIISIGKLDKNLTITSLSDDDIITESIIALNESVKKSIINLNDYGYDSVTKKLPITFIKNNQYSPFSETNSVAKCYLNDSVFIITLDNQTEGTEALSIDLKSKTASHSFFARELVKNTVSYNSLIIDNNIFQVASSKDNYSVTIKNLKGEILKKINSSEIQESKSFTEIELGRIDEIENKKYFKKVNTNEVSLNFAKRYGTLYLNIGSTTNARMPVNDDQDTSYSLIGGMTGGLIGGLIGAIVDTSINSPSTNSNSALVSKGHTYNQLVLSSNFSLLESTKKDFAHQKLKKQIINSNSYYIPSIFYVNGIYYLGFYDSKDKKYYLKKIQDS